MVSNTDICTRVDEIKDYTKILQDKLAACKERFNREYNVTKIKQLLTTQLESEIETIRTGDDNDIENNVYNTITNWTDPYYDIFFGKHDINNCPDLNLNCFETIINDKIKANNDIIKVIKDISGSRNEYNKFIDLLEKAQNTGDASEPRKKVRKQLLQNKNLLAFIYLSAILGGSYYIYRYFKK